MPGAELKKPSKCLAVFCDGTWVGRETKVAGAPLSNIRMLADMVGEVDFGNSDPRKKPATVHSIRTHSTDVVAGYQEGTGLGATFLEYIWNGATASDIGDECVAVYRFIVEHYTDDHEIWLFGFSRGAFTVRCVAGMINNCGIIRRQNNKLNSEQVDQLCYEVFRTYRSNLPIDAPQSEQSSRRRHNAEKVWQVKQPIRCMSVIDTVGSLGIPRLNAGVGIDWASFEFFDKYISTVVQHVRHAPALHDRLWAFQPCLAFPSRNASDTTVEQVWFPGVHYDLGRQAFRFVRQHPSNYIEEALGWLPNLLSRTIWPNEVLADNVLRWILEGVQKFNDLETPIIPKVDNEIAKISERIVNPNPNSTGSGDVYGNLLEYAPAGKFLGIVQKISGAFRWLLNKSFPKLGDNIQDLLGIRTIIGILTATADRRIPGVAVAADVNDYKDNITTMTGVVYSVEDNARMRDLNELDKVRYPSETFETHELWKSVFGDERGTHLPDVFADAQRATNM
ncbi:hypothetical protein BU25DRAFT_347798 [Macroventuria anomochaeta]|uniref:Uncharacterized protein n=1 Tax=Macroventuria anomochaeta TaxID=301207 RepID=A0ACB6RRB9_9PLEO|nr:uncharacterized protein BU25DRAFT_347798 [Macroventuria anomochaeta]KAF2624515.1 hypothetical protein BU25DRAFT_347798 [Macroventuria anomochaeta]